MANNKVVLTDGTVLIDLTGDTAAANHVLKGYTFHDRTGAAVTGTNAFDVDSSGATATTGEILAGKTAAVQAMYSPSYNLPPMGTKVTAPKSAFKVSSPPKLTLKALSSWNETLNTIIFHRP